MENEPVQKPKPVFSQKELDEIELRKLLAEEQEYLERQRLVGDGEIDVPKSPDVPPGFLNNLIEDNDPQAQ